MERSVARIWDDSAPFLDRRLPCIVLHSKPQTVTITNDRFGDAWFVVFLIQADLIAPVKATIVHTHQDTGCFLLVTLNIVID
jgi:hypothetical protein